MPTIPHNDFSELDYKPGNKRRYLLPALIVVTVLILMLVLFIIPGNRDENGVDLADDEREEQQKTNQTDETVPVITEREEEKAKEESEVDEDNGVMKPDHDQLEDDMYKWLIYRLDDPDVIMVHTSELDDVESFLERYSLEEDNIIVYRIESTEDQFAAAVFGLPYSEWSIRAVFIWRDSKWNYLRDEALR